MNPLADRTARGALGAIALSLLAAACSGGDGSRPTGPSGTTATAPKSPPPASACPGYVDPGHCPPFSTAGSRIVTGIVTALTGDGRRPIPGAVVWPWVKMGSNGFRMSPARTDSSGSFRLEGVPDGEITLLAVADGFDQPCVAIATTVNQNATVQIDVLSRAFPLPALAVALNRVTGTVFETTATGRKPVAGATVLLETEMDLVAATTTTDAAGRYALCALPAAYVDVSATKASFKWTTRTVSVAGNMELDFELTP